MGVDRVTSRNWTPRDIIDKAQELYFAQVRPANLGFRPMRLGMAADMIWDRVAKDIRDKYYALARAELDITL
jgi:hypothetical protein